MKFSLIATGDSLITLSMTQRKQVEVPVLDVNNTPTGKTRMIKTRLPINGQPEFMRLIEIIRGVDVAFTNLEMLLHNYDEDCYPAAECGGTYTRAPPEILDELIWMGFDLFSTANNHSLDYMYGGLLNTIKYLDKAGVPHAGTGRDLAEARQPAYLDTAAGRVAMLSACSTFADFGRAGDSRRDMKGRPGLNPLRYEKWYEAKPCTIKKLKEIEKELNLPEAHQGEDSYHFLRSKFVEGEHPGEHSKPNQEDREGNLESIRDAAKQSDWVIFSLHAHEGLPNDSERPAEFLEEFARAAIDAGAHCFIGHGHHAMRGIEIREGKPIFYSLGNFIFQNETVFKMPAAFYKRYNLDPYAGKVSAAYDARQESKPRTGYQEHKWFTVDEKYWMSILPRMEFKDGHLDELTLYPIELNQNKPRSQRGRPKLADKTKGEEILSIIQKLSEPYGTEILIKDNQGIVKT